MPRLLDSRSRTDTLVAAINDLLVTDGIPGLTLRRIAAASGVSTGSMLHHFGGKDRLVALAATLTGRDLRDEICYHRADIGVAAFLPTSDDGVLLLRAWLAWVELGRSDEVVEPVVTHARHEELALLAQTVDYRFARDDLDTLAALVDGLRTAVCAPIRPMPPAHARRLVERYLRHSDAADPAGPPHPAASRDR